MKRKCLIQWLPRRQPAGTAGVRFSLPLEGWPALIGTQTILLARASLSLEQSGDGDDGPGVLDWENVSFTSRMLQVMN